MDNVDKTDRAKRFFVDLMLTLSEDDIGADEAVELLRPLWGSKLVKLAQDDRADVDAMLAAWASISATLATMLVAEGRDCDRTLAHVWHQVQASLLPGDAPRSAGGDDR